MDLNPIVPARLRREEPVDFPGPAGKIEGLWRPAPDFAAGALTAVVAHPHPAHGGTMLNKVVFHAGRALNHDLGASVLRFNFRGVGSSEGGYDEGRGEATDLRAAWAEARRRAPGAPLVAGGFSFGAGMTLRLLGDIEPGELPDALLLIGIPLRLFPPPRGLSIPSPPLAAVHGERDSFTPLHTVESFLDGWPAPWTLVKVPGADHFLEGHLPGGIRAALPWLGDRFRDLPPTR